ncbi:MAG: hypothetical protein ABEJ28_04115 [Salinigranum sp.]
MPNTDPPMGVSRRAVLRAGATGTLGFATAGNASARGGGQSPSGCDGTQVRPGHSRAPCGSATTAGCPDGPDYDRDAYPQTTELVEATRESLRGEYADVGTLLDRGYVPYFDVSTPGSEGGFSHWLNPAFVDDTDAAPDPGAPESVLVDNRWWRPIGAMYVATDRGDPVDDLTSLWGYDHGGDLCSPWHAHVGLPGRFAWWYYRQVYEADYARGRLSLPCATPCMMHVWIYPAPRGPHGPSSAAPAPEDRGGPPANDPGFETPARPGRDRLSLSVLPPAVRRRAMPGDLRAELAAVDALPDRVLRRTSVRAIRRHLSTRLG